MPNWCENNLQLTHKDPSMLKKAIAAWNEGKFLTTLVPEPDYTTTPVLKAFPDVELIAKSWGISIQPDERGKYAPADSAWWDWRCQNWGTKWEIEKWSPELDLDASSIEVSFGSAWSPPIEAYQSLSAQGFEIAATYFEPGMLFCGFYSTSLGNHCIEIEAFTVDWLENNIPLFLIEQYDMLKYVESTEDDDESVSDISSANAIIRHDAQVANVETVTVVYDESNVLTAVKS